MRSIPQDMQVRLDSGATTHCRCWKIERADGRVFGFTDHDLDLAFEGLTFEAGTGLDANALQVSTGLNVDNCQASGALSSKSISEEDIRAGHFDGARVLNWLVDWTRPELRVLLFSGTLGEMRQVDGRFEVELRGLTEALNAPVGRSILRICDRVLGDSRCKVDLAAASYSAEAVLADPAGDRILCANASGFADGWFGYGTIVWLSGENAGISRPIRADRLLENGSRALELWRAPPFRPQEDDRVRLVAGCNKTAKSCRTKFANFLNFRGFPHLPGEDWVAAYPREGEVHDGSSLE
jgi:uncharacterized phage protein (TIGR02218 family)